jgi:hypothetical protein
MALYVPTDEDIDAVKFQVPDTISLEIIRATLVLCKGDVTECILNILADDDYLPKDPPVRRKYPKPEVDAWNEFYKDLDKYNIENNIDRVKPEMQSRMQGITGSVEVEEKST